MTSYDILFTGGKIHTQDDDRSLAQALAVKDGKIAFIGSDEEAAALRDAAAQVIDLQGKMMLPGFIDAHMHLAIAGPEQLYKIVLSDLDNEADYLKRIKEYVEAHPQMERYEGAGWINPAFGPAGPTRQALDAVCPDKPLVLDSGDHHTIWANTRAIELCGIDASTTVPEGNVIEREPDGYPSGAFREFAAIKLLDGARLRIGKEEYKEVIRFMQDFYAKLGVTTIMDALNPVYNDFNQALLEMEQDGELRCKVRAAFEVSENDPDRYFDEYLDWRDKGRAAGDQVSFEMVKILVDGVIEGKTGYLKQPYADDPNYYGEPVWEKARMTSFCKKADAAGFDLHFHVIGDAACAMALDAIEAVAAANPERGGLRTEPASRRAEEKLGAAPATWCADPAGRYRDSTDRRDAAADQHRNPADRRVSMTHLQVVDPADLPRLAAKDVICISNPYWFFKEKGYFDGLEKPYLGERAEHEYPMKDLFDAGLVVGAASDYSVTPQPYPPKGMQIAMTRLKETEDPDTADPGRVLAADQQVSLQQMLDAFTRNNAYFLRDEALTGSLEVGKCADLVVLAEDLFEVPVGRIHEVPVAMTLADGRIVYEAEGSAAEARQD